MTPRLSILLGYLRKLRGIDLLLAQAFEVLYEPSLQG